MRRAGVAGAAYSRANGVTMEEPFSAEAARALRRLYKLPGYLLRRSHQIASSTLVQAYRDVDITPTQYGVLYILNHVGTLDQSTVARLLRFDRSTTGMVIGLLVERGLIRREKSPLDQRRYMLGLTAEGKEVLRKADKLGPGVRRHLLDAFTADEQKEFIRLLAKFVATFSDPDPQ